MGGVVGWAAGVADVVRHIPLEDTPDHFLYSTCFNTFF